MAAQGWTVGTYLGAKDAAHSSHYTAANASHIRVLLKDDTLGLGAGKGKANGENFGLGSFQDILGRLNGKSGEQIINEQTVRADLGRRSYIEKKWGPSRFVSGGYLVGEKIEAEKEKAFENSPVASDRPKARPSSHKSTRQQNSQEQFTDNNTDESIERRATHSKKRNGEGETKKERRERRLERRQKKEEKRLKKDSRRIQGQSSVDGETTDAKIENVMSEPTTETQSPAPTFNFAGSRQAVRQRFIRQKKMASLDANALREVLYTVKQIDVPRLTPFVDSNAQVMKLLRLLQ